MAARINPGLGKKPDKPMRDALLLELNTEVDVDPKYRDPHKRGPQKEKRLRKIARKLCEMAENGSVEAVKEINNRVEGKAVQPLANDVDNPLLPEEGFKVTFIKASDAK